MNPQVILTITSGSLTGTQYSFDNPGTYSIGRETNCNITFPDIEEYSNISRYHCHLQILHLDPPNLKIIDRKSTHGTFVNGRKVNGESELLPSNVVSIGNISIAIQTVAAIAASKQPTITVPTKRSTNVSATILEDPSEPIPAVIPVSSPLPFFQRIKFKIINALSKFLELYPDNPNEPTTVSLPVPNRDPEAVKPLQFPDYQVGALLGRGAVSEVYLAIHQESLCPVALKTLQPSIARQPEAVQKFIRETEYTKALNHPQVVKLLDFNYAQEGVFYTTEYCEGGSLFMLMKQLGGQLPAVWAKTIILQILDGLDYIHQVDIPYIKLTGGGFGRGQGLVHRSLKPENILLKTAQGKLAVKISDFALAQALSPTGTIEQVLPKGSFAGTPYYMPRAQVVDFHAAQPAIDIWAAVACLYEMLTGQTPRNFDDQDPMAVVMKKPVIPIGDRVTFLPPALAELIDQALSEEPDHSTHYQRAIDFKTDLLKVW
jgi:eukaryotic-like serine/threonine-protein kinase